MSIPGEVVKVHAQILGITALVVAVVAMVASFGAQFAKENPIAASTLVFGLVIAHRVLKPKTTPTGPESDLQ